MKKRFFIVFAFVIFVLALVHAVHAAAAAEADLSAPVPLSGVDYYKLAYEENGSIVWKTASYSVGPNFVHVISAPAGYTMADAVGFGVWMYSSETEIDDAYLRFTLIGTPIYTSGVYSSPFVHPHFNYIGAYLADGRRAATKLSLGYINENSNGSVEDFAVLDVTCYADLAGTQLTDDEENGNVFFCVFFDMPDGAQSFRVVINGGKVNSGVSSTISALLPSAGDYNTPEFSGDAWDDLNESVGRIGDLLEMYDPFTELSIPAALAAVYNPVLDGAYERFVNGSDRVTFSLIVLVFGTLTAIFIVTKLRRDAS